VASANDDPYYKSRDAGFPENGQCHGREFGAQQQKGLQVAVIIPSYRVTDHILGVIERIGKEVASIYVVDDCCPVGSGAFVTAHCQDPRVKVIRHEKNLGVGGAVITGIRAALEDGMDICVKVDGDGQMDPQILPRFVMPIADGFADYTKGNRFYYMDTVKKMPVIRLIGNAALSFFAKLSSGYWDIFDPNNGYVAISSTVARELPLDKISRNYFFESDVLFRLSLIRARVIDIPMHAIYGDEQSNMKINRIIFTFMGNHIKNFIKRIVYNYFVRDFSIASMYFVFGVIFLSLGVLFGIFTWVDSLGRASSAPTGTVMLVSLQVIVGVQLLLSFMAFDVANVPSVPIQRLLARYPIMFRAPSEAADSQNVINKISMGNDHGADKSEGV